MGPTEHTRTFPLHSDREAESEMGSQSLRLRAGAPNGFFNKGNDWVAHWPIAQQTWHLQVSVKEFLRNLHQKWWELHSCLPFRDTWNAEIFKFLGCTWRGHLVSGDLVSCLLRGERESSNRKQNLLSRLTCLKHTSFKKSPGDNMRSFHFSCLYITAAWTVRLTDQGRDLGSLDKCNQQNELL